MSSLSSVQLADFTSFAQLHLGGTLLWSQAPTVSEPPNHLPDHVRHLLAAILEASEDDIDLAWSVLREIIWDGVRSAESEGIGIERTALRNGRFLGLILQHGIKHNIGFLNLYPPVRCCVDPRCARRMRGDTNLQLRELTELRNNPGTLFTRDFGAVPTWVFSARCKHCNTRYYPNYYVQHDEDLRTYYGGIPRVISIGLRHHIETSLCVRFSNLMVCAWTSATNLARTYNLDTTDVTARLSDPWLHSLQMSHKHVWTGFFLHALLLDSGEHDRTLNVPNETPPHFDRLRIALEQRNAQMVGPGQELWNHACKLCCELQHDPTLDTWQALRATVTDGVTIGHPCCGVLDCKEDLLSQRDKFCFTHQNLSSICVVTSCNDAAEIGFQTCSLPEHRQLERVGSEEHSAMFQLRKRLERVKMYQVESSILEEDNSPLPGLDEVAEVDADGSCEGKSEAGNAKPRARFGRRRTHNEELCVTTCGVVLGRATFYGSESPNGVRLFHRALFPTINSMPGVNFHDNNCNVKKVIHSLGDTHFDRCALPVDVFHMKSKHKATDNFCNEWCNPVCFPDLISDGKWRFNSSAAEMTNAWFGGYQAIVREMRVDRYEFFLDEMVKQHNRILVNELQQRGAQPYQIPRSELLAY